MKIIQTAPRRLEQSQEGIWRATIRFRASGGGVNIPLSEAELTTIAGQIGDDFPESVAEGVRLVRSNGIKVENIAIAPVAEGVWELEFSGSRVGTQPELRGVTNVVDADANRIATAEFTVPEEQLSSFLPKVGDSAPWAGGGYLVCSVKTLSPHAGTVRVTITAKHTAAPRLIAISTDTMHAGYSPLGNRLSDKVWRSRWSVPQTQLEKFLPKCGDSAASWAERATYIAAVSCEYASSGECIVKLEARSVFGYGNSRARIARDDRSSLGSRVDIEVSHADLRVSLMEAGYRFSSSGVPEKLSGWKSTDCPLETVTQFPRYERPLRTIVVKESRYYNGSAGEHIERIAEWHNSGPIFSGKVGKLQAKWLKVSIYATDMTDNQGRIWPRLERTYRQPPSGERWNLEYWKER